MQKTFKEYLDTEMNEIMAEAGRVCAADPMEFNDWAIAWIQRNAANFREKWNKQYGTIELSDLN